MIRVNTDLWCLISTFCFPNFCFSESFFPSFCFEQMFQFVSPLGSMSDLTDGKFPRKVPI
jgi:hypothetical protein